MTKKEILNILLNDSNVEIQQYAEKELQALEKKENSSRTKRKEASAEKAFPLLDSVTTEWQTAKEIAAATKLTVGSVNARMRYLVEEGLVVKDKNVKRLTVYKLA